LLAVAAEFGDVGVDDLRTVLAFSEAMRAATAATGDAAGELPIHNKKGFPMRACHERLGAGSLESMIGPTPSRL
jgi:hypothetical protein